MGIGSDLLRPHVDERGLQDSDKLARRHRHQKPAAPAVDEDAVELSDRRLQIDGHGLAGPKRRRAADLVARVLLGNLRGAGHDTLAPELSGEVFGADVPVAMHEHDAQALLLVLHDERLDDLMLVHAEGDRRRPGAALLLIFVEVFGEGDRRRSKASDRSGDGEGRHEAAV